jgi:hypothetical protein
MVARYAKPELVGHISFNQRFRESQMFNRMITACPQAESASRRPSACIVRQLAVGRREK